MSHGKCGLPAFLLAVKLASEPRRRRLVGAGAALQTGKLNAPVVSVVLLCPLCRSGGADSQFLRRNVYLRSEFRTGAA
jgi:hypothetical protein